jgi:hypothetical protein
MYFRMTGGTNRGFVFRNDTTNVAQIDGAGNMYLAGGDTMSGNLSFGSTTRQMINLYATEYAIGVQSLTTYFRTGGNFAWYSGGSHNDGVLNAGGGTAMMALTGVGLGVGTTNPSQKLHVEGNIYASGKTITTRSYKETLTRTASLSLGEWYTIAVSRNGMTTGRFVLHNRSFDREQSIVFDVTNTYGQSNISIVHHNTYRKLPNEQIPITKIRTKSSGGSPYSGMVLQVYIVADSSGTIVPSPTLNLNVFVQDVDSNDDAYGWTLKDFVADGTDPGGLNDTGYPTDFVVRSELDIFQNTCAAFTDRVQTGDLSVTGDVSATGDVTAYASDGRLKKNVEPLQHTLDTIKQLGGYTYEWRDDIDGLPMTGTDMGLIAQSIQKTPLANILLAPAPFDVDEHNGTSKSGEAYLTIRYNKLHALWAQGLKEQQEMIEHEQAENRALRQTVEQMTAQMEQMTAQMEQMMTRLQRLEKH